jgi:dTDP-4-amino-4,6-dideoxy-D-galactose acyltransferase
VVEAGVARNETGLARRVELRELSWDTSFFGSRMGEIAVIVDSDARDAGESSLGDRISDELQRARIEQYEHVILRIRAGDSELIAAAERAGMRLVDIGIDSVLSLAPEPPGVSERGAIRESRDEDISAIAELAGEAFTLSRFHVDPFFTDEQVIRFHRQWATNLCRGLAQTVLVAEEGNDVVGFVSCSLSDGDGRIPLIATKPDVRRRGIGFGLVSAALDWFRGARARTVRVKTQSHNYSALRLYDRIGFMIDRTDLTFSAILR